jgi:hypothetical protein
MIAVLLIDRLSEVPRAQALVNMKQNLCPHFSYIWKRQIGRPQTVKTSRHVANVREDRIKGDEQSHERMRNAERRGSLGVGYAAQRQRSNSVPRGYSKGVSSTYLLHLEGGGRVA